jgi:hypothetical protein
MYIMCRIFKSLVDHVDCVRFLSQIVILPIYFLLLLPLNVDGLLCGILFSDNNFQVEVTLRSDALICDGKPVHSDKALKIKAEEQNYRMENTIFENYS